MQQYIQEQTTFFAYEYPWIPLLIVHASRFSRFQTQHAGASFSARFHPHNFGPEIYVFQSANLISNSCVDFQWSDCFRSFLVHHLEMHQIFPEYSRVWNKQKLRNENAIDDPNDPASRIRRATQEGIYPVETKTDVEIWMDPMLVREWGVEGASLITIPKPELICSTSELYALSHLYKVINVRLFVL